MWVGQCIAQMVGAKIFNDKNNSNIIDIYGCVTTGEDWLFLKLNTLDNIVSIDSKKYYIDDVESILGIFSLLYCAPVTSERLFRAISKSASA